jgi:glycosyltransferase involved in cell wall biosynthesis
MTTTTHKEAQRVGRFTIILNTDEEGADYSIQDSEGYEVDGGYEELAEAIEAAETLEADTKEEDREWLAESLRDAISEATDECEDIEKLRAALAALRG